MTKLISIVVGVVLAFSAYSYLIFSQGVKVGEADAVQEFQNYVISEQRLALEAVAQRQEAERKLREVTQTKTAELSALRIKYEEDTHRYMRDHAARLQSVQARELHYRQLSEAGAVERGNLADIAARLDRTLAEGRLLVGELRQELVLRNQQLTIIGEQLLAERNREH